MRKLIISWGTYDWILYCYGLIRNKPKSFDIMIVCDAGCTNIIDCKRLCVEAVRAQRRYEMETAGRNIGVTKLFNLGYDNKEFDSVKFIAQLQLYIMLGGINEIYCLNNDILTPIVKEICKNTNKKLYLYGDNVEGDKIKLHYDIRMEKLRLVKTFAGMDVSILNDDCIDDIEEFKEVF